MNYELDDMRQQMAILREKLQKQEIVNDQLLRKAIGTKLSRIKLDRWKKLFIIALGTIYIPWMLYDLIHAPLWFIVVSIVYFAFAGLYSIYYTRGLGDGDLSDKQLLDLQQKVIRMKRQNARWLWFSIPIAAVWVAIFLWLIVIDQDSAIADGEATPIIIGALIGGAIGSIIGTHHYRRQQHHAADLISEIEELTKSLP